MSISVAASGIGTAVTSPPALLSQLAAPLSPSSRDRAGMYSVPITIGTPRVPEYSDAMIRRYSSNREMRRRSAAAPTIG